MLEEETDCARIGESGTITAAEGETDVFAFVVDAAEEEFGLSCAVMPIHADFHELSTLGVDESEGCEEKASPLAAMCCTREDANCAAASVESECMPRGGNV